MNKTAETIAGMPYENILDALPYYVLLIDSEHIIVYANKATRKIFNKKPDELIGKYCPEEIHGKNHPVDECPLEESCKRKKAIEKEIYEADTRRWLLSSIYPTSIKTESGKEVYLHIVIDITDKKEAEKQLSIKSEELVSKNIAMKELLECITSEKKEIEEKTVSTLEKLIMPKLRRLSERGAVSNKKQVALIQKNIQNAVSSFGRKISGKDFGLSPREIEISDLIRNGLKNKVIARELKISLKTAETTRKNIRKKLKIKNKKINLRSFLIKL